LNSGLLKQKSLILSSSPELTQSVNFASLLQLEIMSSTEDAERIRQWNVRVAAAADAWAVATPARVTHDLPTIDSLTDKIAVLEKTIADQDRNLRRCEAEISRLLKRCEEDRFDSRNLFDRIDQLEKENRALKIGPHVPPPVKISWSAVWSPDS
jgi:hypothetical protein